MLECNIFPNVRDSSCLTVVKITSVLAAIKSGKWKDVVLPVRELKENGTKEQVAEAKKDLPAVTWSGVFEDKRMDANIVHYNKLMVIDIDKITKTRLKTLKKELKSNKAVYCYFDGPTKGIKVLMFIDSEKEAHNTHAFWQIETMFDEMYGIEVDPSGKNIARLCFVSYDPDMYLNPEPMELHIVEQVDPEAGFTTVSNFDYDNASPETDATKIFDTCIKMTNKSKCGHYYKGNRNKFVFVTACLLCEFGVNPELSLSMLSSRFPSLKYKEHRTTVESAFRRSYKNFGTKSVNQKSNNNQQSII